jgi:hypothetical protein
MKKFFSILAAMAALVAAPAMAHDGLHADGLTHQAPTSARILAAPNAKGYLISWTEPLDVQAIEIYFGHGTHQDYVSRVNVGDANKAVQLPANTRRLNLIATDGRFLHVECGGNDRTSMPTLVGLEVDCSYVDNTGHAAGALVIAAR